MRQFNDGDVARHIPQLASVDPEQFAVSVCTVDGQRMNLGDHNVEYCVQSCSKPISYALALSEHGPEKVSFSSSFFAGASPLPPL